MVQMRLPAIRRDALFSAKRRRPIILLAAGLLLMPAVFYLEGTVGPVIFNERYLQPVEIGLAFVVAELITLIRQPSFAEKPIGKWLLTPAAVLLFVMVAEYDLIYLPKYAKQQLNYTAALTSSLPPGVPVVCEDAFTFTELMHMEADSTVTYEYMLDWQNSISDNAPRLEVTEFHLMENWKKVGYFANHIEYRDEFLAHNHYFLILETIQHEPGSLSRRAMDTERQRMIGNPLARRFAIEPGYSELPYFEKTLGNLRQVGTLVCRQTVNCSSVLSMLKKAINEQRYLDRPTTFEAQPGEERESHGYQ